MEKIISWLNSDKNYYHGLALLQEYSKNRWLLQNLTRKPHPAKLEYELKRLLPKGLKVAPKVVESIIEQIPDILTIPTQGRTRIIRSGRTVQMEDLPERLQKLYLQNVELYKKMRALHERAKLIREDSLRAPVTQLLVEYDDQVHANWAAIDSWDGQPDVPGGAIDHRRINANRKFITDNRIKLDQMPAGKEHDELKLKMQQRIDELLGAGEQFSKIKSDLIKQGFRL